MRKPKDLHKYIPLADAARELNKYAEHLLKRDGIGELVKVQLIVSFWYEEDTSPALKEAKP